MNEELKIKLTVDTSQVQTSINKLKNDVSNVNKTINSTSSSSSTTAKNTDQAAKSQTKLTDKVTQMIDKVKSVKGMGFLEMVTAIAAGNKALDTTQQKLKEVQKEAKKLSTRTRTKAFESVQGAIDGLMNSGTRGEGFVMNPGSSEKIAGLHELGDKLMDTDSFKDIFKLTKEMKTLGGSAGKAGAGLKGTAAAIKALGAAATAAAATLAVFVAALAAVALGISKALKVSQLGDEIYHTASRFNMGTEAFQEWSWVMERAGGSIDDLTGFMETLASEQAAVIEGSEDAAANFKRLGLSMEEVAGMGQQELFTETVKRIQGIEDATQRSAIAYSIFGDEASKFMNVLNMSNAEMAEQINNYHLLGGAMSGETLEASNKLQNSVAAMKEAWKGAGNAIGQVFMPIAQKLVEWLTKVGVIVQLLIKVLFGLDLKQTGAGDAMDKASGSANKYSSSIKKATKSAEELKRITMGFDELNIVSDPNKSSADSDAGTGSSMPSMGGMGLTDALPDMSDLGLDGIYAWFEEYKGVIAQIATWSLLLIGILLAVIGCCTMNIPLAAAGIAMAGLGIAIGIKSGAFAEAWDAATKAVSGAAEAIGGWISWLGEKIAAIGDAIWDGLVWLGETIVAGAEALIQGICNIVIGIIVWIDTYIVKPIVAGFTWLKDTITTGITIAITTAKNIIFAIVDWINTKIVQPVGKFISGMWDGFKSGAKAAWEGIKSVFSGIANWFKDIFTKAWSGVKAVFSTGGKIFDGIKDGIASVFKTVVNGIIGGINKVIKVPFDAINGMLNKIRNVDILGVEPFKGFWKQNPLSVPQIPQLAKGGIATGSILANIGENGKEAVLPLENNTEWMDALADRIAERNSAPTKVVLQVGEKELGWATINSINNITKQTGNIQLAL